MNQSDRMQLKAALTIMGIVILLFAALSLLLKPKPKERKEQRIPVVEEIANTYITSVTEGEIQIFNGEHLSLLCDTAQFGISNMDVGQVCDIILTDGIISNIYLKKQEKKCEKVIRIDEQVNGINEKTGIILEESGYLPCIEDVPVYLLYGEMRTGSFHDIRIGYAFADFILEDGKICAILVTRDETMDTIRVLIKNSDYLGNYHESVVLSCDGDYGIWIQNDGEKSEILRQPGEELVLNENTPYFTEECNHISIVPKLQTGKITLTSVSRAMGAPSYRGNFEISKTEKGFVIINEVLLEEYLYGVVPSEMPSNYPMEALKAQAICARTYAYGHMISPGLKDFGAHVDDSTGYQVYQNIAEQNQTTQAVKETAGLVLYYGDEPINTYYYSTSCGYGSDEHVWKSDYQVEYPYLSAKAISKAAMEGKEVIFSAEHMMEEDSFAAFIEGVREEDFESGEPWYRWTYDVDSLNEDQMVQLLKDRFSANQKLVLTLKNNDFVSKPIEDLGKITNIYVNQRNAGGVCDELIIVGEKNTIKVISEFNIRYVLCDRVTKVRRQDGSEVDLSSILPSAFFEIIPKIQDGMLIGYTLYGGGFGHGAGMSQNAAKHMANAGYSANQILEFFYQDGKVQGVKKYDS